MNCPKCQAPMREREREVGGAGGREVVVMDVCATCGGIWLDKGELEKLTASESRFYADRGQGRDFDDDDDDDDDGGGGGRRGRRGGFLGNLFDFGD